MYVIHKLRPDRNFYPILVPFGSLLVAALLGVIFEPEAAFIFLAIVFWGYAAYGFLVFVRTHNSSFVVQALFQITAGVVSLSTANVIEDPANKGPVIFSLFCELFFMIWLVLLVINRKMKWRGRDILELAAAPVEQVGNGYTARPLPAGKTEFTQRQIMEFSEFARRNLLAFSYISKDKVVFVPIRTSREFPYVMGFKSDYLDDTWVAFDFNGNISVNISHRDYLEFMESLAFDQLCESMGNLFVEFIEMFHRGEGVRVLDLLDALKIPYYA
jgi:hypothetical protein